MVYLLCSQFIKVFKKVETKIKMMMNKIINALKIGKIGQL